MYVVNTDIHMSEYLFCTYAYMCECVCRYLTKINWFFAISEAKKTATITNS